MLESIVEFRTSFVTQSKTRILTDVQEAFQKKYQRDLGAGNRESGCGDDDMERRLGSSHF